MSGPDSLLPWEGLGRDRAVPMKQAAILVDIRRCVGCHACGVACKTENDVPLGGFRIRTHYVQRPDRPTFAFVPMMCQHCKDAPCIPACPNEAIERLPDGRVDINKAKCKSDTACMDACPYGAIHVDPQTDKADKCNLCTQRTEVGLQPACVEACPTEALRFGDIGDKESELSRLAAAGNATQLKAESGTNPAVRYIGLQPYMQEQARSVQLGEGENGVIYEQ